MAASHQAGSATPLLPISFTTQQASDRQSCCSTDEAGCFKRRAAFLCALMAFGLILVVLHVPKSSDHEDTKPVLVNQRATDYKLNYLVVGDWGRQGLYNQSLVAQQMGKVGEELGIQFVVSVGDNFYNSGLTGVNDSAFTTSFTDVYTASSLQTTWYAILGNHDYRGDALAQFSDELAQRDWRWFCRRQFQLSFPLCDGFDAGKLGACDAVVDMFFFDTTPFVEAYWKNSTSATYDWRGLAPREEQLQSQLEDLALKLQASNATWKIVVGHHTMRSVGSHGDTSELVDQLLPVLEKYDVDMYINGHDHILQHIKRDDSPVHFFTSGGGSKSYAGLRSYGDDAGVQFVRDGQGFLFVSMSASSASFNFYNVYGDVVYSYTITL